MHNETKSQKMTFYAKILFAISITLLVYGTILDINGDHHLLDPVRDVEKPVAVENTVTVSTVEETETSQPEPTPTPSEEEIQPEVQNNESVGHSSNYVPSIGEQNNQLKIDILSKYGVSVKYGNETEGYSVTSGNTTIGTTPITDPDTIHSQLLRLKSTLDLYPSGLFMEIKSGGIPLTVILVDHYSNVGVTGITDSSYNYANISIAAIYPFEESFFHESYHYIERYLFKKGANFNSWNSLNPADFAYGTVYNDWSYNITLSQDAPFVNNYAQTADTEDRASTFEYMMAPSKAACLNKDKPIWAKAKYIALTIENTMRSVDPNKVEYWERYL